MIVLKDKNTKIDINFELTEIDTGLTEGDKWCLVHYSATNDEIKYFSNRLSVSISELYHNVNIIEAFVAGMTDSRIKLKFIKNYFIINLYTDKLQNKIMEYSLFDNEKANNKPYIIKLQNDEITKHIADVKKSEGYQSLIRIIIQNIRA